MKRALLSRSANSTLVVLLVLLLEAGPTVAGMVASKPTARRSWREVTSASWYGHGFNGKATASGSRFNAQRLTAAHRTLRLGTKVKVTELRTGRSVVVQITDRGPFIRGRGIDLSYAAARQLGIVDRGIARVAVELIRPQTTNQPIVIASAGMTLPWMPRALVE